MFVSRIVVHGVVIARRDARDVLGIEGVLIGSIEAAKMSKIRTPNF